jgi:sulfide:quinone oxidoreductase
MKKKIIIIGGGTAGITSAARLRSADADLDIVIIDSAQKHFYQPLWTLVGAGVCTHEKSERDMQDLIPSGVSWIKKNVMEFEPDSNQVKLDDGTIVSYDVLIVCPGIQMDWDKIKNAKEALEFDNVCSNYLPYGSTKTWEVMKRVKNGNAIFTQPPLPIKCAGAPQKATYLADDFFRNNGLRSQVNVVFANSGPRIFGVEKYRVALEKVLKRKEIDTRFEHNLTEIRPEQNMGIFTRPDGSQVELEYSMLHIVPPMSSPAFIKKSQLADSQGWVDVDKFNLQHVRYKNIFSLGDASSLPTSRTGAAIRKQAPVLVANVMSYLKAEQLQAKYDGYTSCPLVTGYGKVIMAEFDYDGNPAETFPFDQSKERYSMWFVKAHLLPVLYWNGMLKGRA